MYTCMLYLCLQIASPLTPMLNHQVIVDTAGISATTQPTSSNAVVLNLWVITPKGVIWHFKRGNINFQNKKEVTSMANVVMRFYSKSLNMFHS